MKEQEEEEEGVDVRALVIYESMYGNTHVVANAIAQGLAPSGGALVVPVDRADQAMLERADLVVVGGPTHAHGVSRESTRKAALNAAHKPGKELPIDPDASGVGLRDWFDTLGTIHGMAAAFDTRANAPAALTGRAAKGIGKMLRHHGLELVLPPESFLVDKDNHLLPGEEDRARAWGVQLASTLTSAGVSH
ncbi:MAG: flavodoxin family protein [Actinomycetes bacterium]